MPIKQRNTGAKSLRCREESKNLSHQPRTLICIEEVLCVCRAFNELRYARIGNRADPAASRRGQLVFWLGRRGIDRCCFGVSRFGESLDSARTQALSPFGLSLALLLLWVQRNLHVGPGTAPAQSIPVPTRAVGSFTAIRKSKPRTLSGLSVLTATPLPK